jgi:uncharacterized membrane protein (DUF373 family)
MDTRLKTFERIVVLPLIAMMVLVISLTVIELAWIIIQDLIRPPILLLEINDLLDIFSFFLLILIGVELLETIKAYLSEHVVHVEIVLEVALVAIARKVIILDVKELPSLTLIGVAAVIIALAAAYYVEKRSRLNVAHKAAEQASDKARDESAGD